MKIETTAILTGDIVGSRNIDAKIWLQKLKSILNEKGKNPTDWEIFRGDMFQLETTPELSLQIALEIKARIRQIKNLDVRIAIGIGTSEHRTKNITESNGNAYTNSGTCFDSLKKRKLAIKTPWKEFNEAWDLKLRLASLTTDNWKPATAQIVEAAFKTENLNQTSLAKKLNRSQSTISESLKRAGYDEIKLLLLYFMDQVNKRVTQK